MYMYNIYIYIHMHISYAYIYYVKTWNTQLLHTYTHEIFHVVNVYCIKCDENRQIRGMGAVLCCMYIFINICSMYVCMYMHVICIYLLKHVRIYVYTYVCICMCMYVCMHVICIYLLIYVCIYVYTYVCIYMYMCVFFI